VTSSFYFSTTFFLYLCFQTEPLFTLSGEGKGIFTDTRYSASLFYAPMPAFFTLLGTPRFGSTVNRISRLSDLIIFWKTFYVGFF
jgi:hypothetical protein